MAWSLRGGPGVHRSGDVDRECRGVGLRPIRRAPSGRRHSVWREARHDRGRGAGAVEPWTRGHQDPGACSAWLRRVHGARGGRARVARACGRRPRHGHRDHHQIAREPRARIAARRRGRPIEWRGRRDDGRIAAVPFGLLRLFLVFAKIGSVLFGSGYVLLAFLRADLVERLGWLTEAQLLDAIAIGQITPGPVFTTATFIGYVLGGSAGAAVATVGIFLPAFSSSR